MVIFRRERSSRIPGFRDRISRGLFFFLVLYILVSPALVAYAGPAAYVVDTNNHLIGVDTNDNTVRSIIDVGDYPHGVAVNPAGTRVYVTNSYGTPGAASGSVSVVDAAANAVMATIPCPSGPHSVAVSPDGATIYVGNLASENVAVIDGESNTVTAMVPTGSSPYAIAFHPDGTRVYVGTTTSVLVFDTASLTVTSSIPLTYGASIDVHPDGRRFFVASNLDVYVVDAVKNEIITSIPFDGGPTFVVVHPDGTRFFVGSGGENGTVTALDALTYTPIASITIGQRLNGLAFTPDGAHLYVLSGGWDGYALVLSAATYREITRMPVGQHPRALGRFIGGVTPPAVTLKVMKDDKGFGKVASYPAGIDCGGTCAQNYWINSKMTLTASPEPGSSFVGWSGPCTGSATSCDFVMGGNVTVTAMFATPKFTLKVNKEGSNCGTVKSSPSGIDCGADCSADFWLNGKIQLIASPAGPGCSFEGWSGACTDTDPTCDLVLTGDVTVTAKFLGPDTDFAEYLPLVPKYTWNYLFNGTDLVHRKVLSQKVKVGHVDTTVLEFVEEKSKEYYTVGNDGILLHKGFVPDVYIQGLGKTGINVVFSPPLRLADAKGRPGQLFHSEGMAQVFARNRVLGVLPYSSDSTIDCGENVTVPAGVYHALRNETTIKLYDFTISSTRYLARNLGVVKDVSTGTDGQTQVAELVFTNAGSHDLAVTQVSVPAKVMLTKKGPQKTVSVTVTIQNRSLHPESIKDRATLANLITLTVQSLGSCVSPTPALRTSTPFTIPSKGTTKVKFDVSFSCANDPLQTTAASPGHDDFRLTASVNHAALDDNLDTHPSDDVCPRSVTPPYELDPYPDGTIRDRGCGARKKDGTLGGDILTDVVVK